MKISETCSICGGTVTVETDTRGVSEGVIQRHFFGWGVGPDGKTQCPKCYALSKSGAGGGDDRLEGGRRMMS